MSRFFAKYKTTMLLRFILLIFVMSCSLLSYSQSAFYQLAKSYADSGDYTEAIRLETEVLNILKEQYGEQNIEYAKSLSRLAHYNAFLHNYQEAVKLETIVMKICKDLFGEDNLDYANSLSALASYNVALGNYNEAIRFENVVLKICDKNLGVKHPYYVRTLSTLAAHHDLLGNFHDALKFGTLAMELSKVVFGEKHPDYIVSVSNLAVYYSHIGNYHEALNLGTIAMEVGKEALGENNPDYVTILNALATYNSYLCNYNEAVRLGNIVTEIRKEILGVKHPDYARSLSNLAAFYEKLGNNHEAMRLATKAMEIRKEILGEKHPDYARSLSNLAVYYSNLGEYNESIRLRTIASEIQEETLGDKHPDYIMNNISQALDYILINDERNLKLIVQRIFPNVIQNLVSTFRYLPLSDRQLIWNKTKYQLNFIHTCAATYPNEEFLKFGYNSILLSKGILLNTEQEFIRFISENVPEESRMKYKEIRCLRQQLNKMYEKPMATLDMDVDSLEHHVMELERQFMYDVSNFGGYTKNLSISMEEIKKKLRVDDVAIEFVSYPTLDNNRIIYAAYVLKKDMEVPVLVKLLEEKDLLNLTYHDIYSTTKVSKLIWKNLKTEIGNANNVYFAPIGILNQIAIEYLPDFENDGLISDRYNIFRLSSTREIALNKPQHSVNDAVIYGGIKYDSDIETMVSENARFKTRGFLSYIVNVDSLPTRSHYEYLKFSLTEAETIDSLMKMHNLNGELISGDNATETSFKNLSGKHKNIIHIATHGFYWEKDEAEYRASENPKLSFLIEFTSPYKRNTEDLALTRTGLLMAGANNILRRKEIPGNIEDGILTAKEIADLDFKDLDLVVLSACQTGLGEISSEGVFGLQRGFKKAGANSILMSLWDVNDEATQIFMTEFYKAFLSGISKQQSLQLAQLKLRNNARYSDPEYWAAFILLDALN